MNLCLKRNKYKQINKLPGSVCVEREGKVRDREHTEKETVVRVLQSTPSSPGHTVRAHSHL